MPAISITVDFLDGTPDGSARVELSSVVVYKIPKSSVQSLDAEKELKQAGIYLLRNTQNNTIYVGQADSRANGFGLLGRMTEPHSKHEIDEWDVGYALTNNIPLFFGATELNFLERYFYDEISKTNTYDLLNGNRPHASNVSHSTQIKLDGFTKDVLMLLKSILGFDIHKEEHTVNPSIDVAPGLVGKLIYIKNVSKCVDATAIYNSSSNVVVKSGSSTSIKNLLPNQKNTESVAKLRNKLIDEGIIKSDKFTVDHLFHSVSTAAEIILCQSANGWDRFVDAAGNPIDKYRKK